MVLCVIVANAVSVLVAQSKTLIFFWLLFSLVAHSGEVNSWECNKYDGAKIVGEDGEYFLGCNSSGYTEVCLDGSLSSDYEGEAEESNW